MSVQIKSVMRHSYADRAGIRDGETLLSINGNDIVDVLDYRFYQLNSSLELKVRDLKGEVRTVRLRKPEYDELGLDFETHLMDKEKNPAEISASFALSTSSRRVCARPCISRMTTADCHSCSATTSP